MEGGRKNGGKECGRRTKGGRQGGRVRDKSRNKEEGWKGKEERRRRRRPKRYKRFMDKAWEVEPQRWPGKHKLTTQVTLISSFTPGLPLTRTITTHSPRA